MIRRRLFGLVATGGIAALAGCSGAEDGAPEGNGESQSSADATTDGALEFRARELVSDDGGAGHLYGEVVVENTGDADVGTVTVEAEWFDDGENVLGEGTEQIGSLDAGETWIAWVPVVPRMLSSEIDEVVDFSIRGEYESEPPAPPEGMRVAESELVFDGLFPEVVGSVENDRADDIQQGQTVQVMTKLFDDDGRVTHGSWSNETQIPAETDFDFSIGLAETRRTASAATHEVRLNLVELP